MSRGSQVPVILVLVGSLLGAGAARHYCIKQRHTVDARRGEAASSEGDVSRLNSFALGLLLGGLRGPMLMALWTSSENQKTDRELDDFDTKVDLIRLLQAEFDGVHLFQIWNKAYNISVQMANVPTKYTTILDAMDYAFNVNKERPDNINMLGAIGGLYFDKFGGAAEKGYYSPRLMDETLPVQDRVRIEFPAEKRDTILRQARLSGASTYVLTPREANGEATRLYLLLRKPAADALQARVKDDATVTFTPRPVRAVSVTQASGRRTEHDPVLDENYKILPALTAPREGFQKAGVDDDIYEGAEMPYLKQFEPYPIGVSPYALAYNYFKRAQWLQKYRNARHAQLSDRVVSSRAALSLKKWAEEDWYAARRAEIELFSKPVPQEDSELEAPTQNIGLGQKIARTPLLDQIIFRYTNAARIADAAVKEYEYHLRPDNFPGDAISYASHRESSEAQAFLMKGDAFYLQAMVSDGPEKIAFAKQSAAAYRQAASLYTRHIFKFFTSEEDAAILPKNVTRAQMSDTTRFPDAMLPLYLARLKTRYVSSATAGGGNAEDFNEINSYVERAYARLTAIAAITQ